MYNKTMLIRKYKKMYKGLGLHKRGDKNHEVNVSKKIRKICGSIFLIILFLKISFIILIFVLPDYPVRHTLNKLNIPYEKTFNWKQMIGIAISCLFIIPAYGLTAYATLNVKHKMTDFFFSYTSKRVKKLLIIILISYGLTFYFSYTGYSDFVDKIDQPLSIIYFIPAIIHFLSALILLSVYYLTSEYLKNKSDYKSRKHSKI